MTKKFAMIAAVSISALLILFSACSKEIPAVKLKGLISSGEYSKAVNYYLKNTSKISESEAEELFKDALNAIGISEEEIYTIEDTSFIYHGSTISFDVIYYASIHKDDDNYYVYSHCASEKTAKKLFDYYYDEHYADAFDNEYVFSGYKISDMQVNNAFFFVDGSSKTQGSSVEKHDALYLFGDTVVYVSLGSNDDSAKEEIDTFMDALGYYHP